MTDAKSPKNPLVFPPNLKLKESSAVDPAKSLAIPSQNAYMGADSVYYCENSKGHVYITTPESPIREGYIRKVAETASDIDRFFAKMHNQARIEHERLTEAQFKRNEQFLADNRSNLNQRLLNSNNEFEKAVIRAWIQATNNVSERMQRNSVYGVAAMQEKEAPLIKQVAKKETIN